MKSTDELIHQIKEQKKGDLSFLDEKEYNGPSISVYLCDLLTEHHMEVREAIKKLGLERTYGYQMFNGTRKPTRTMLVRLGLLLKLSLEEVNRLLKIGGKEALYPRRREDAAAIYAIEKKLSLEEWEDMLEEL